MTENNNNSDYAIYCYDFHVGERSVINNDKDGNKFLPKAQKCFAKLFDLNTVEKLAKTDGNGKVTFYENDVLAKAGEVYLWRVNNRIEKEVVVKDGTDSKGIAVYKGKTVESLPPCNVIIDNRPDHCIIAIEKSTAFNCKTDTVRDFVLETFNRNLSDEFQLEMRIEAMMEPSEVWDFVHRRLYEENDYIEEFTFKFENSKKVMPKSAPEMKRARLKSMQRTLEISDALRGIFTMFFDRNSNKKISQKNKDMAEMVNLCCNKGYDIQIKFKNYKTYRINDYVKRFVNMDNNLLTEFRQNNSYLFGDNESLILWLDKVIETINKDKRESEIPKRRKK